jgi:hypothetical protein
MSIEKDVADKILRALVDTSIVNDIDTTNISTAEQIRIIKANINNVPRADRRMVLQVVVAAQLRHLLVESPEGTTVNLDKLPPVVISEMYKILAEKLRT